MLEYLNRLYALGVSERAVSRQTGIPRSTLYAYRKGIFKPPAERTTDVHDYYRKVQYRRLRYQGASTGQANRFKNASFQRVNDVMDWYDRMVKQIADTYGIPEDWVRDGLSKSKKSIEDIEGAY